ncbi:putative toxin-antitoxin system toxin component, PIN family [Thiothrix nivea]|uniref:PIN domain-containing protein n=1 Tax=Thiothrix nivea (strain ATCC 35100 / DSM 5205 / JP2) TaxID=870187 RepID=A0A656HG60_THINJ|nr:putative toxin-antitoxin system toxin component, PIN family [Thiothrix nivea]EIJ34994.1 protein of unknown function DUF132 [Thiothrix nivea DSM 5205]
MIIVVDTNIFVGACMGSTASSLLIELCLRKQLTPLMGAALFAEYSDVLNRASLFRDSHLSQDERSELLDIFLAHCRWTDIYYGWRPNLRDEGDNHLVELAVAGQAECVVTHNVKDLSSGELLFPNLGVMTPQAFLEKGGLWLH